MRIRLLGSAARLPWVPAHSSDPIDIAIPTQVVCTSHVMDQLRHDQVGHLVVDRLADEDHPVA